MYDIIEILVFSTPFDKLISLENKIEKLITLFKDYAEVSDGNIKEDIDLFGTVAYKKINVSYGDIPCNLRLYIREETQENIFDFYTAPKIRFYVSIQVGFFDLSMVETLLNDTIRFFSGLFQGMYFVDVDSKYSLQRMNEGKKYLESDLKNYTFSEKYSEENKAMIDALLYLRYNIKKNLLQIEIERKEIEKIQSESSVLDQIEGHLDSASKRSTITVESLQKHLQELDARIIFVHSILN